MEIDKEIEKYEEFKDILDELYDELPPNILKDLNGGIRIIDEVNYHSVGNGDLVCLGAYRRDLLGKSIVIYYGSFMKMYSYLSREDLKTKLRETLHHEITHHIEFLAGEKDLEIEDLEFLREYKRRNNGKDSGVF